MIGISRVGLSFLAMVIIIQMVALAGPAIGAVMLNRFGIAAAAAIIAAAAPAEAAHEKRTKTLCLVTEEDQ